MDKLYHLSLEPYKTRYTEYLKQIETNAFDRKFEVVDIPGIVEGEIMQITAGEVLDAIYRPLFALQQVRNLLQTAPDGLIYCSDFYTPGLDALAYSRRKYRVYGFCWAQSVDVYDFTARMPWMHDYEAMAFEIFEKVFVATQYQLNLLYARNPVWANKVEVVGLPFDPELILKIADIKLNAMDERQYDVVYSSRLDKEKSPMLLVDLIRRLKHKKKFAVCTGFDDLRGTDEVAIKHLKDLAKENAVDLHVGLTKRDYLRILNNSKVQLNTALQDWVSFTLLEALTMGCAPLYPNWRAFPEVLGDLIPLYPHNNMQIIAEHLDAWTKNYNRRIAMKIIELYGSAQHRITDIIGKFNYD